jgi:diguanylate cyclase (GGDEF)-like protein
MEVRKIMQTRALAVQLETRFEDAVIQLAQERNSCLIVVHDKTPVGIVTERDITLEYAKQLKHPQRETPSLSDVMTKDPICIREDTSYENALSLARSRKLRHLPVVNAEGELTGLVTQNSLLKAFSRLLSQQSKMQGYIEELKSLSLEDPLMGIGNRRAMEVDLQYTQSDAERRGAVYSLALLDIDFFKYFNDDYGHQKGDEILRSVARHVCQQLRSTDRVFRYGGEEILVLMPGATQEQAELCAERIRTRIEKLNIPNARASSKRLTLSAGVCSSSRTSDWQSIVNFADVALYKAKGNGRNQVVGHRHIEAALNCG